MNVTTELRSGYLTCARDRVEHGDCPGYASEPVELIVETVVTTLGESHGDMGDPYYSLTENTFTYLHTLDGEPPTCRHCGHPASLSLEPRPSYQRLSEKGPDELVRMRALERAHAQREQQQLEALERQIAADERTAVATEALVAQGQQAGEVEQLREVIERQQEQLDRLVALTEGKGNGNGAASRAGEGVGRGRRRP